MKKSYKCFLLVFVIGVSGLLTGFYLLSRNFAREQSIETATASLSIQQAKLKDFRILLVDDDNGTAWHTYFTGALDALGLTYDMITTNPMNSESGLDTGRPNATVLSQYRVVIWTTGDFYHHTNGDFYADAESNLTAWLQTGGRLFLSSQDWLITADVTNFFRYYLGVIDYFDEGINDGDSFVGTPGDPISGELPLFNITYPASMEDYGDWLTPASFANVIFRGNITGNATAVRYYNTTYNFKTVFFATPFEAFDTDRTVLMEKILVWLVEDLLKEDIPGFENLFITFGLVILGLLWYRRRLIQVQIT